MLTGECFCGKVKYRIDGDLIAMYVFYPGQTGLK
jgi:hypothetical protein